MADSEAIRRIINSILSSKEQHYLLAAIKGLRNGAVYGAKVRFPHALVMTFLFGKGSATTTEPADHRKYWTKFRLQNKALVILKLTRMHSMNLARFAFSYKLFTGLLAKFQRSRHQWHSAVVAALVGYYVFGEYNGVNMQINLYLLSRVVVALARLAADKGYISEPKFSVFPLFAAGVWGLVLWLFEYHKHTLQPSLQNSMTYLYHDSNYWTSIKDFLFVNKLE